MCKVFAPLRNFTPIEAKKRKKPGGGGGGGGRREVGSK